MKNIASRLCYRISNSGNQQFVAGSSFGTTNAERHELCPPDIASDRWKTHSLVWQAHNGVYRPFASFKKFLYPFTTLATYLSFVCLLLGATALRAQESDSSSTYFFKGDEVFFEFDLRYIDRAKTQDGQSINIEDIDISKVSLQSAYEERPEQSWRLTKVGATRYQLRRPISDFDKEFPWIFKFVINDSYATAPIEAVKGESNGATTDGFWKEVYPDADLAFPSPRGNTDFFLPGYVAAENVILTGDFIGWREDKFAMQPTTGGWSLRLQLPAGYHEYKYIVDGEWVHDPVNPRTVWNQYHSLNSVIEVKKEVRFKLDGYKDAREVYLAGSFTNWKKDAIRMWREGNKWVASSRLTGGKHLYKFIVDGEWITDPANPLKEYDREGHINSALMVK